MDTSTKRSKKDLSKLKRISKSVLQWVFIVTVTIWLWIDLMDLKSGSTLPYHRLETVVKQFSRHNVDMSTTPRSRPEKTTEMNNGLLTIGNNAFYVFTLIAQSFKDKRNKRRRWMKLYVTGWEKNTSSGAVYKCCFRYEDGTVFEANSSYKTSVHWPDSYLRSRQVICPMDISMNQPRPKSASLAMIDESCKLKPFKRIFYNRPIDTNQFAISGKVAYSNKIEPKNIIEWVEYYKYLGVSKIVIYIYHDLYEPARRVMDHYVKERILEIVLMPSAPERDKIPRYFDVQNGTQGWQDHLVYLLDTEQRLRSYSYYAVIDMDEYIVPKVPGVTNLTHLMDEMLKRYPKAGSFRMKVEIHITNWPKTNSTSGLLLGTYGLHAPPTIESVKFIHVKDRIREGSVWIHSARVKRGFRTIKADPAKDFVYKHYRTCKAKWLKRYRNFRPNIFYGAKRIRDTRMEDIAKDIGPEVKRVVSTLMLHSENITTN